MNQQRLFEFCKHMSLASGLGVIAIDGNAEVLFNAGESCVSCMFCKLLAQCQRAASFKGTPQGLSENCDRSRLYGSYQSMRFAGRYIFFCHVGLTLFASPIIKQGKLEASVICGPFLMIDKDEFFVDDIVGKGLVTCEDQDELRKLLDNIPSVSPERVQALSEILYLCSTSSLEAQDHIHMEASYENQKLSGIISDYIMRIKGENETGGYPLQKENELLDAMSKGDTQSAKALLNEILGFIYFYSGFKFDIIRSRVLELIVLISRAAVKGGADAELIFGLNYEYLKEIDRFKDVEEITYWLSKIMNRFTEYVFNFVNVKHADVIYKATEYIKANYMNKLTLEDVAGYVYLSPSYFSKVFKDETGSNFNSYLNKVRIEQSKKLLLNKNINMSDISNLVGYEDQSYFSKVFKKLTGTSPLRFRQSRGK